MEATKTTNNTNRSTLMDTLCKLANSGEKAEIKKTTQESLYDIC